MSAKMDKEVYEFLSEEELPDGVLPIQTGFAMSLLARGVKGDICIFCDGTSGVMVRHGDARWYCSYDGVKASHQVCVSWINIQGGWYATGQS